MTEQAPQAAEPALVHAAAHSAKSALRQKYLPIRKGMPQAKREAASAAMIETLLETKEYADAQTVFGYASMPEEVQLDAFLARALADGKRVAIPQITQAGVMEAVELPSLACLETGAFGIRTVPEAMQRVVPPEDVHLIVVPGLVFTKEGARVGLGGGYYDRYLVRAPQAARVALAFDALIADRVTMESHDAWVDAVITETRVFRCERKR